MTDYAHLHSIAGYYEIIVDEMFPVSPVPSNEAVSWLGRIVFRAEDGTENETGFAASTEIADDPDQHVIRARLRDDLDFLCHCRETSGLRWEVMEHQVNHADDGIPFGEPLPIIIHG